ncbi:MAG: hypothetical protein CFE32_06455 [Alphaproteobacteria bacterium PA3]|nr:MAG: hypothetical protein CFE32_06455 [Alphaproteobacteria bacterium PA3]
MILDTKPEMCFDGIVAAAASIGATPIALISLVDQDRQWFKARFGLEVRETPRSESFCTFAIQQRGPMMVEDALADERFAKNPLVVGEPFIRAYLGLPIVGPDDCIVGTLCLIDRVARTWTSQQLQLLEGLAHSAAHLLQVRLALHDASEMAQRLSALSHAQAIQAEVLEEVGHLAKVGGWSMDLITKQLVWSEQTRQIHEVDDDFVPNLETAIEFYAPDARSAISEAVETAQLTGEPWDLELPLVTAKGTPIWVRAFGRAVVENGEIKRLVGAFQDISEDLAKRLELQETASCARQALADVAAYQAALDAHAIVATTDAQGKILFANDMFCQISGYTRDELIGVNHRILNSGMHEKRFFHDMWRTIRSGNSWQGEICNRTKSGTHYWVDTTIVPMIGPDGVPERYVAVRYDITAQKEANRQLEAATSQVSGFFEVAHEAILVADTEGRFVKVNPAFEHILGYSISDLEQSRFVDYLHPEDHAETLGALRLLGQGQPIDGLVNRYRAADGSWRHMEWRATPKNGFVYASARDISERLSYQAELERARLDAERATAAKSQFLANMSHEIRTPLNGVIGIAGALARLELADQQREMVELILTSSKTLERLLNDILDVSKIEAGKLDLEIKEFDLIEEIEAAAHLMRIKADEKGVDFEVIHSSNSSGRFLGDAIRLRQIITNLCSNAIKFTHKGSVKVSVNVLDGAEGDKSKTVQVAVSDTGIGFDDETAKRLFGRFEQADGTITREFGGTGLGLSISKVLAEMMGGGITASSIQGVGSRFDVEIRLPKVEAQDSGDKARKPNDGIITSETAAELFEGLKILVAEDHPINQKVIKMILDPCRLDLTIASNGLEAIAAFDLSAFDAILMDMQMPEMDGLTAIEAIREREWRLGLEHTPIAVLSANAMAEHLEASFDVGADAHISKPVTPDALYSGLMGLLQKRHPKFRNLQRAQSS